ncbi:hypothetical protein D6764_04765 [Candidatus Woesearchaeota archaeon]|nr:MAG: hypothetical protein D6764_04765 [Candidatus Woesearchaeota archaeon]
MQMRMKDAMLAWVVLNLFLVPALASVQSPVGAAAVSLEAPMEAGGFARTTPLSTEGSIPFAEGSTVAYSFSGTMPIIIYALISALFLFIALNYKTDNLWKPSIAFGMFIALPFITSEVFAAGINSVTITGEKGIPDFVPAYGTMYLAVNVTMPGDANVTKDQLAVRFGRELLPFNLCNYSNQTLGCEPTSQNDTYICNCINMLGSERNPLTNNKNSIKVLLYSDRNKITPADARLKTFYMDNQGPAFTNFKAEQIKDRVQVTVTAQDPPFMDGGNAFCAGLSKIELYNNGVLLAADTINVNAEPNNCTTFSKTLNTSISQSGNATIYAIAYDNLGNTGRSGNDSHYLDFDEPVIDTSFKVYQGGSEVNYISTDGPTAGLAGATIEVTINEHSLKEVQADMSSLNDNIVYSARYKNITIKGSQIQTHCVKRDETYKCRFDKTLVPNSQNRAFFIRTQSSQLSFNITAIDEHGLKSTQTVTANMMLDNDRPDVKKLGTANCNAEKCYFNNKSAVIQAVIDDAGSGLDYSWVFLDAASITRDNNHSRQMYCSNNNGQWRCLLSVSPHPSLQDGHAYRIMLNYQSVDDAGNPVDGERQALVYLDEKAPEILENETFILSVHENGLQSYYTLSGDILKIFIRGIDAGSGIINENGAWDAAINLGDVLENPPENSSWVQASICIQEENGKFDCRWEVGPVVQGPLFKLEGIPVRIRDVAGNLFEGNLFSPFIIYQIAETPPGDVWKLAVKDGSAVRCMPEYVDRSLIRYYPGGNKIWCEFTLTTGSDSSTPYVLLDVQKDGECIPTNLTKDYFESSSIFGNQILSSEGVEPPFTLYSILKFDAQTIERNITEFAFVCPYRIRFANKNTKTVYDYEIQNVSIIVPVKGGDAALDTGLHNQVEHIKATLKRSKWIDSVDDVLTIFRNLCNVLNSVVIISNGVLGLLGLMDWLNIPGVKQSLGAVGAYVEAGRDGVFGTLMEGCLYISCKKNWLDIVPEGKLSSKLKKLKSFGTSWAEATAGRGSIVGDDTYAKAVWQNLSSQLFSTKPEDSLILSTIMLCIPGIFYNINKARQIDCYYVFCMEKMVPLGTPAYACQSTRYLMYCKFVIGQFFAIVPFGQVIKELGRMVADALSDPLALAGYAAGAAVCKGSWLAGLLHWGFACDKPIAVAQAVAVSQSLGEQFKQFKPSQDFCQEVGV